jgi:hypothetical protein
MYSVVKHIVVILAVLAAPAAWGDELYFKYGKSIAAESTSKVFTLGVQQDLGLGAIWQGEAGLLSIPANQANVTAVASLGLGVKVDAGHVFAAGVWGPSYYSSPDGYLGGRFQFNQDLTVGLQDSFNTIGVGYKHISSAGIYKPNKGRDYLYFRLGVKF